MSAQIRAAVAEVERGRSGGEAEGDVREGAARRQDGAPQRQHVGPGGDLGLDPQVAVDGVTAVQQQGLPASLTQDDEGEIRPVPAGDQVEAARREPIEAGGPAGTVRVQGHASIRARLSPRPFR
ncbi:hypothetical protein OMR07_05305 [Methylobacterium organophilum]|nr:hypothetical protein [Methylobacterium organophilum]